MKEILQDYSLSELQILMEEWGERKFRAAQIFRGLMQGKRVSDLTNFPKRCARNFANGSKTSP